MNTLEDLATALGISLAFQDAFGTQRKVPRATLQAACAALGYPASDAKSAQKSLARLRAEQWAEFAPPVVTLRGDRPLEIPITVSDPSDGLRVHWELHRESGITTHGAAHWRDLEPIETAPEGEAERRRLRIDDHVTPGYHDLTVSCDGAAQETHVRVIAAPARAYQPPPLSDGGRVWALSTQLYALRSDNDWGIGDFAALSTLIGQAADAGAAAIGLNPLHVLFADEPERASPYSPSSRLFLNPLYLAISAIADFPECEEAQRLVRSAPFRKRLDAMRERRHIDYEGVTKAKMEVLRLLHDSFRARHLKVLNDTRRQDFRAFQAERGSALRRYAIFEALREQFGADDPSLRDWRRWPQPYRHPDNSAVAAFAAENIAHVEFFEYLQWQTELQLATVVRKTASCGMALGFYGDLAVGIDGAGADAWAHQDIVVAGFSTGAPPDPWAHSGQNWGFPPLHPREIRRDRYRIFSEVLVANFRHAGALRIDHALGLMRMFWVPENRPASEGVYVDYPFDDLLAVVVLESHRNKCLVVGEDLGTLPPSLRESLQDAGLYSYRLLYFERNHDGSCKAPGEYPVNAVAAVSTHDLPTLVGYWAGTDIDLRERFQTSSTAEEHAAALEERARDKEYLAEALRQEGFVLGDVTANAPRLELHRLLARTPSRLLVVQLDDAVEEQEQFNLPGTDREYPNWRRRHALPVAQLMADPLARDMFTVLRSERPPPGSPQSD